jgi:hypothetical protein
VAALPDQRAVGLVAERDLADAGERQGVGEPEQDRHQEQHPQCRTELTHRGLQEGGGHGEASQPMPGIWDTSRSTILIPTKGATIPPIP